MTQKVSDYLSPSSRGATFACVQRDKVQPANALNLCMSFWHRRTQKNTRFCFRKRARARTQRVKVVENIMWATFRIFLGAHATQRFALLPVDLSDLAAPRGSVVTKNTDNNIPFHDARSLSSPLPRWMRFQECVCDGRRMLFAFHTLTAAQRTCPSAQSEEILCYLYTPPCEMKTQILSGNWVV